MILLRILFYITLIILVFRLVFRYIVPYILKWYINKRMKNFKNQNNKEKQQTNEGEITINYNTRDEKRGSSTKNIGDYVDYKEVKEDK